MITGWVTTIREDWERWLWGTLVVAVALNLWALLWPTIPTTLVVQPDPLVAALAPDSPPVLVQREFSPGVAGYALMAEASTDSGTQVLASASAEHRQKSSAKKTFSGVLNLNQASAAQLQRLPGIGPKMAQRIIVFRKLHGGFHSVEQLLDVEGIGPKKFEKLVAHCRL